MDIKEYHKLTDGSYSNLNAILLSVKYQVLCFAVLREVL